MSRRQTKEEGHCAPRRLESVTRVALPSTIASSMPVSRIREIMELAWEDPQVIHLEVGEPDFPTPSHIVDAAHEAARAGHTRYAPNAGLPELRGSPGGEGHPAQRLRGRVRSRWW